MQSNQEINLQELAITFLTKLDARYTPEEQAVLLTGLNSVVDNFGDVIKTALDPQQRAEIIKQAENLIKDNQGLINDIGFKLDESIS